MKRQFGSYIVEGRITIFLLLFLDKLLMLLFQVGRFCKKPSQRCAGIPDEQVTAILLIEIVGMGDAVLTTSILRPLKKKYPRAKICLLANSEFYEILSSTFDQTLPLKAPWVRKKRKIQWLSGNWVKFLRQVFSLRKQKFDISIDCRCDFRTSFLAYLINSRRRIGFDYGIARYFYTETVAYGEICRRSHEYCKIVQYLQADASECRTLIKLNPEFRVKFAQKLTGSDISAGKYYLLHIGTARRYKKWPLKFFAELVDEIVKSLPEYTPVAFGSEADRPDIAALREMTDKKVLEINISVGEIPYLINAAKFIVCNNTGVLHIADALSIPAITFIGPTDERIWSPCNSNHLIFQESRNLDCYPCGEEICVRPETPCIGLIHPKSVMERIIKTGFLDTYR